MFMDNEDTQGVDGGSTDDTAMPKDDGMVEGEGEEKKDDDNGSASTM